MLKEICERELFTGCNICMNVCKTQAISFETDNIGHIYPKINTDKCVGCNLCYKNCPSKKITIENEITDKEVFVCWNKDSDFRNKSTSGGAISTIAKSVFEMNGVVYSSKFNDDLLLELTRFANMASFEESRGTKYVKSSFGFQYNNILNDLKKELQVLVVGTPCQIAALKMFLKIDYPNLLTVDFICHGVPSNELMISEVIHDVKKTKGNIVQFRDNNKYIWRILNLDNRVIFEKNRKKVPYCRGFDYSFTLRESCYNCKYINKNFSDFTVGDYWLAEKIFNFNIPSNGVSCLIANDKKHLDLLKDNKDLFMYSSSFDDVKKGQFHLNQSAKKPKLRKVYVFFSRLNMYYSMSIFTLIYHFYLNIYKTLAKSKVLRYIKRGGNI